MLDGGNDGAGNSGGGSAILGCQATVAARQRQPVGLAYRRGPDDRDTEIEIENQPAHDGELLVVLLPEHGEIGFGRRQQLGHDRGNALEVSGSAPALHRRGKRAGHDACVEPARVHRRHRRCVHEVHTRRPTGGEVVVDRRRIVVEVGRLAELQRIDEDRHDDGICERSGVFDEAEMATVQRTHRRDERHRPRRLSHLARPRPHPSGRRGDLGHGADPTDGHRSR